MSTSGFRYAISIGRFQIDEWRRSMAPTTENAPAAGANMITTQGRNPDLLQGLGHRAAGGLQPRLAAQRRRLGRQLMFVASQRLPRDRPRPARSRPLEPALERQRHGHLRRRPGRGDRGARPARHRAGRTLDRRRRGHPLHRPARHVARGEGGAGRRDPAVDAEDGRRTRRACRSRRSTRSAPASAPTARSSTRT